MEVDAKDSEEEVSRAVDVKAAEVSWVGDAVGSPVVAAQVCTLEGLA